MTDDKSRDEQPTDEPTADEAGDEAGEGDGGELPASEPATHAQSEPAWQRRRRLSAAFGDVLPDTTRDEREPGGDRDDSEEWLRRQVPPHHGS